MDHISREIPLIAPGEGAILELVVRSGPQVGLRLPCRRVVTLAGSREGCKIRLNHSIVAHVHLAIVKSDNDWLAVDLVTSTGSLLNGLKLEHETIHHGDAITVGPWEFGVEIPYNHGEGSNGALRPIDADLSPHVVALEHLESGRILQSTREVCVIGRRPGCDIHLADESVSRAHAILFCMHGYPVIVDLLTPNHTFVNDEAVSYRQLKDLDVVRIGDATFRVRIVVSGVGERAARRAQAGLPAMTASVKTSATSEPGDLIDIQAVEGAQRWHIAEHAARAGTKQ